MSSSQPIWSSRHPLRPNALRVLQCLEEEARARRGWLRRGVRGWRLAPEVETLVNRRISGVLPGLWTRGYVDRIEVVDPGRQTPVHLYRIAREGVGYLASEGGGPSGREIVEPTSEHDEFGATSIYIPRRPWLALDLLRRHAAHRLGPIRWGENGWMTTAEMRPRLSCVLGEDMPWLLSRGLVERRVDEGAATRQPRPVWFYRASAQGLEMELVDAAAVGSGPALFVQLRPSTGPVRALPTHTSVGE